PADPAVRADVHPGRDLRARRDVPAGRSRRAGAAGAGAVLAQGGRRPPERQPHAGGPGGGGSDTMTPGELGPQASAQASGASAQGAHTLGRWPTDRARLHPERAAIVDRGVELTYQGLDQRAEALARDLVRAGYRRGDRVATLVGNSAEHVITFFACARTGLVLVPLSWRLTATELADQLTQCDPSLLLVEEMTETLARGALSRVAAPVRTAHIGQVGVEAPVPAPWHSDSAG